MFRKETGYPSIDKTHEKNEKFFDIHPMIPNLSIYHALKLMSSAYKKENAIDCLDLRISYEDLIHNSVQLSKGFKELGIKAGDIITVSMPNFYQAVATYLAANRIGAVTTFLNPSASIEEHKRYLNLFESPLFLNYNKGLEYNESIKKDTKVRQVITLFSADLNEKAFKDTSLNAIGNSDFLSFAEMGLVADHYKKPINTLYNGKQDSLILYTSGTTGNPKAVVLTNKNILASGIYMKNSTHLSNTTGEKSLVCVPFTYPYGFATSTLMSLLCGREAVLAPTLNANNIGYYFEKNPNIILGSPAFLEMVKRNVPEEQDLSSVHTFISGGDFLTPSQIKAGKDYFKKHRANVEICNGSGNAETVGASTNAVGLEIRPETVGRVLLGTDAIVRDEETGLEVKYGEEGILCIGGEHVFKEYFKSPELTEDAKFTYKGKEYVWTGTRGFLSTDGYFTLTGRASRFYIISTLNKIYCDYVQNIMSMMDMVDACAVVKKTDDEMLYTGKAFVVLKNGIAPSDEMKDYILEQCRHPFTSETGEELQLKQYEIPTSISFVDQLPRTQADKIDYPALEKLADEEYQQEKNAIRNKVMVKKK